MVDFVKLAIINITVEALKERLLRFRTKYLKVKGTHSENTGDCDPWTKVEYKGLKLFIHDNGYIECQLSLHKFKNGGRHNFDDFTYAQLQRQIKRLAIFLGVNAADCILQNIEFGVNISPPIDANKVLSRLLVHRCKPFEKIGIMSSNYRQAEHGQYFVKVYDKAKQYRLTKPLMRYELKFNKMEAIKRLGVKTLEDLTKVHWVNPIGSLLLDQWLAVILYDVTVDESKLSRNQKVKKIHQWQNTNNWIDWPPSKRNKERKAYEKVVRSSSKQVQDCIGLALCDKWTDLQKG